MNRIIAFIFTIVVEIIHVLALAVVLLFLYFAFTNEEFLESTNPVPELNIFLGAALVVLAYVFVMGLLSLQVENYKNLQRIASIRAMPPARPLERSTAATDSDD